MNKKEEKILESLTTIEADSGKYQDFTLETDRRVFARITDGIYRNPSAAIRELIFNAYDADASEVYINTDAPSFRRITVRDNGNGMSDKALISLMHHIGGSMKRTGFGEKLGITKSGHPDKSPGGRHLIGKLGIGLFSVVQLTRHFQIVTKKKGLKYRLIAEIKVSHFRDEDLPESADAEFKTGDVRLWKESAEPDSHGTDINLFDIKPVIIKRLRSEDMWFLFRDIDQEIIPTIPEPVCHIGEFNAEKKEYIREPQIPFSTEDTPENKMRKIIDVASSQYTEGIEYPWARYIYDEYFKMIWDLSISIPASYCDKHPFLITGDDEIKVFKIPDIKINQRRQERVDFIELKKTETINKKLNLKTKIEELSKFKVYVDGIRILRPVKIHNLFIRNRPTVKEPMIFIGKFKESFKNYNPADTGGELDFEAYIFFNTAILPPDLRGVQVRIHNASGTGFDTTFMNYLVSEQNRLRQVIIEIFVSKGMDAALNIDRESFNISHPHFLFLQKWLHFAIGRYVSEHKRIGTELSKTQIKEQRKYFDSQLTSVVDEEVKELGRDEAPPKIFIIEKELSDKKREITKSTDDKLNEIDDSLKFISNSGMNALNRKYGNRKDIKEKEAILHKAEAIGQILYSYGVFEHLPQKLQEKLMNAVLRILSI